MGGGTSHLFYGTQGSRELYQFSFSDVLNRTPSEDAESRTSSNGEGISSKGRSEKELITVETVLKMCQEYHDGALSATQLAQWLLDVITDPNYTMKGTLKSAISHVLKAFSSCLTVEGRYDEAKFQRELESFEQKLRQIR